MALTGQRRAAAAAVVVVQEVVAGVLIIVLVAILTPLVEAEEVAYSPAQEVQQARCRPTRAPPPQVAQEILLEFITVAILAPIVPQVALAAAAGVRLEVHHTPLHVAWVLPAKQVALVAMQLR
jgi:hypothetical protein